METLRRFVSFSWLGFQYFNIQFLYNFDNKQIRQLYTTLVELEIILVLKLQDYKIFIESQIFLSELNSVLLISEHFF